MQPTQFTDAVQAVAEREPRFDIGAYFFLKEALDFTVKRVMETKRKGIVILPFVSLAREKMFALQVRGKVKGISKPCLQLCFFQNLLKDVHVRVCGFMGSQSPPGGIKRADIAVCTIEKANSLINR